VTLPSGGDGFLPVDKPVGPTSHDVVAMARRGLGVRRVGHTGTLDPFASGLLLLCVGRATRLAEYLHELPKRYEATARLGQVTATLDPEGPVVQERSGWEGLQEERVREVLASMVGHQEQIPPSFSAKKVKGEAAYRRARRGEEVELPAVPVEIHELRLEAFQPPWIRMDVACSTGTYIRALARDIGERLDVGAHLTELRRTAIGPFDVAGAIPLDRLDDPEAVARAWISPIDAVAHLPRVELAESDAGRFRSGQAVQLPTGAVPSARPIAVISGEALVAVGMYEDGALKPRKVFPLA
jgi:tRNA pseudouridine55 synthase